MGEKRIASSRYEYVHKKGNCPSSVVDIHHVRVLRRGGPMRILFLCFRFAVIFVLAKVEKESVLILPAFGVQLETHYSSGRVVRRFIPVDKILKPVPNEYITPVTCYWSLALILREENEVMLVFKVLHPTVDMLVPIWKALCAATDSK